MLTLASRLDAMNRLGRALADPTRCQILLVLLDGAAYPAQLAESLNLTRSNVSNHLTCLRGCGLIVGTPEGRQMRYELVDAHLAHALTDLLGVVLAVDAAQPCVDEGTVAASSRVKVSR
jgi:DNA-binding transcriptional ArsR family regulator